MKNQNDIQKSMFLEVKEKKSFDFAKECAYQYWDNVFERNVYPGEKAIKDLKHFEEALPDNSTDALKVIELLNKYGSPATVAQVGGRYFGFVCGSSVPAGIAAKSLATFWDQNTAMTVMSPLASKLESVVEKWLVELLGLPDGTAAGFVSGTTTANFCGLAAARYKLLKAMNWDVNRDGLMGAPRLRIVAGKHAHSSVLKALNLLGFGSNNIEWVDVDDQGRIIPDSIPELDAKTILILQAGNVNTGSFDPFEKVFEKVGSSGAWVHVDGAFGLWAAGVEKFRHLTKGFERADSWAVDAHKTLNAPYDSGIVLCKERATLLSAMQKPSGSYLILDDERDGMLYTPEMSRRARIIELWATIKSLGKRGISEMIEGMHQRAVQFGAELKRVQGFQVINDIVFNQVLVCCATDEITELTMKRIQDQGECWVGGSTWNGVKVIRISVCSWATTEEDVLRSVGSFATALKEVKAEIRTSQPALL